MKKLNFQVLFSPAVFDDDRRIQHHAEICVATADKVSGGAWQCACCGSRKLLAFVCLLLSELHVECFTNFAVIVHIFGAACELLVLMMD